MLKEYRYQGRTASGKTAQGVITAGNGFIAKKMINEIAEKHQLNIISITPKRTFLYTIPTANGKAIKGKQEAYTKQEVAQALSNIGYGKAKIQPSLLEFKMKPPFTSILMFINLSSFMLKEKLSYDRILRMLADEETNPTLKQTLKKIESELKKGKEGTEVFARYADVFGKFPAYMLGLATKSGNMSEVYDATAKFMQRDMEYRKSLKQAIMMPMVIVVIMMLVVAYYIMDIFPSTANLFVNMGIDLPPMTKQTLDVSNFLGANWWWMALLIIIPIGVVLTWWKTPKGSVWRDHFLIKLPAIGHLLHKSSIEIFFRVFAAVYSGAENNIDTLTASAEACRNAYIEKGIKEIAIPLMLKEGMSLVPALSRADVFNHGTLSRLKTGTETGNVLQSAKQISTFYEKETTYKMGALIESIQLYINLFIAVVITWLTVVSSEIATVNPPTPGM
ncbi:MAG: type II secretion system F family protein [Candidatus Cloacimonetes bacterium]|nr:type II secretion system F family protein [Candidatus Cloacimonadota bacterium]